MYRLILYITLVLLSTGVYSEQCNDCINYEQCPEAKRIIQYDRTPENIQLLQSAFCGFNGTGTTRVPMVCCSVFSNNNKKEVIIQTAEDERITNHKNLELLPEECGAINGDRIVGGEIADLFEFPWIALISYNTREGYGLKCEGSIINKRYILTAAHCLQNHSTINVRVGEYNTETELDCQNDLCEKHIQDIEVEKQVIHEDFGRGIDLQWMNDIALLRVKEDIDFNYKNVHRICLPTTSELRSLVLTNRIATVIGWGQTENGSLSSVLLKVNIPIRSPEECIGIYGRFTKPGDPDVTTNKLCAGILSKDACDADSGGPLVLEQKHNNVNKYVQYGIVSYGPKQCGSITPGVYADVTKYMGWILDNISP